MIVEIEEAFDIRVTVPTKVVIYNEPSEINSYCLWAIECPKDTRGEKVSCSRCPANEDDTYGHTMAEAIKWWENAELKE